MLLFGLAAVVLEWVGASPVLVFIFAALGIIPLADLIGEATEELTIYTGPRVGGLLNATLGNAAELIITIFAIKEGLLDLVKASITGSILGNLLLVLGISVLVGGLRNGIQSFDRRQAALNGTMLILAVVALIIPSLFSAAIEPDFQAEKWFSESVAVVMIIIYALGIVYSLTAQKGPLAREAVPHEARWSLPKSLIILLLATLGTALISEILVGAVEHVTTSLGLTEIFLGIILIPLIGNVAEHLVAVEVASKNDMELSLAISLGSSLQIALFVAPLLVFISLLFDHTLLLIFDTFELVALFGAALVASIIALDGESNWLEGAQLLAVYLIVGLAFFFLPG
ncbi:MAG: calcium/proton exchanger [Anaerolineae bacterium]|nr:calcium/proton exchanger [Anaerolineae bacterium]